MNEIKDRHQCEHCHEDFCPDYRNANRQRYCSKPECRKAGKSDSQRRWLNKPENQEYFQGPTNVLRVQEWRKKHPGYSRKKRPEGEALQEPCDKDILLKQSIESERVQADQGGQGVPEVPATLKEICCLSQPVVIGMISQFTGQVLQEEIHKTIRKLYELGQDILNRSLTTKGGKDGIKESCISGPYSSYSEPVQLGGSPSGA